MEILVLPQAEYELDVVFDSCDIDVGCIDVGCIDIGCIDIGL